MPIQYRNGPYMDCGAIEDEIARLKASRALLTNAIRLQLESILDGVVGDFQKVFPGVTVRPSFNEEDPTLEYAASRLMFFPKIPGWFLLRLSVGWNLSVFASVGAVLGSDDYGYHHDSVWVPVSKAEAALRSLGTVAIRDFIVPQLPILFENEQDIRTRFQTLQETLCQSV